MRKPRIEQPKKKMGKPVPRKKGMKQMNFGKKAKQGFNAAKGQI